MERISLMEARVNEKVYCNCNSDWERDYHELKVVKDELIHIKWCPTCGMNYWTKKGEEKVEKKKGWRILKPISGKTVYASGPCDGEFDVFTHKYGWLYELTDWDIQWVLEHKLSWIEYLRDKGFLEKVQSKKKVQVNFWGNMYVGSITPTTYYYPSKEEADRQKKRYEERLDCWHVVGEVRTVDSDYKLTPYEIEVNE